MKHLTSALLLLLVAGFACQAAATEINKDRIDTGRPYLTIDLVYNYDVYTKPFFFKPKAVPTFVIWVENPRMDYIESIFITDKAGYNKWSFTSKRPEVVPVWYGVKKKEEYKKHVDIDAISAATPRGETVTIFWQIPETMMDEKVELYIEANNSFDYNPDYHRDWGIRGYSAANGQPSMVWRAMIDLGDTVLKNITPTLIGHGHVLGKDHSIDNDLSKVTTAMETFREIRVRKIIPYTSLRSDH